MVVLTFLWPAKKLLHGADIIAVFQQVCGKGVPEGMATDRLIIDARQTSSRSHGFLQAALIEMMAALYPRTRVDGEALGGEDILPTPLSIGTGILDLQRIGQINGPKPFFEILIVQLLDAGEVLFQGREEVFGQDGDAILFALAIAHGNAAPLKINVLDAQADAFEHPQPTAVEQFGHQLMSTLKAIENPGNFVFR
jgi:hypothetical protein